MYEIPMTAGLIPSLYAEGSALFSSLTAVATIGLVMAVFLYLILIALAGSSGDADEVATDDVATDVLAAIHLPEAVLQQAA